MILSRSNSEDPADIERKLVLCTFAQLCVHFKLCTSTAVCVYTTRKPHLHKYEGLQLYSLSSIKATNIVALDKMHHLRPFVAPGQKNKLIEISRNYLAIFNENSRYLTSNACNLLEIYVYACVKAHIVVFYQTRHLRLFLGPVRKN